SQTPTSRTALDALDSPSVLMSHLIRTVILVCLFAAISERTRAQHEQPWTEVAPSGELFRVSMPTKPIEKTQTGRYGPVDVSGKLFDSTFEDTRYAVWALNDARYGSTQDIDDYLDACADLIWEDLLK